MGRSQKTNARRAGLAHTGHADSVAVATRHADSVAVSACPRPAQPPRQPNVWGAGSVTAARAERTDSRTRKAGLTPRPDGVAPCHERSLQRHRCAARLSFTLGAAAGFVRALRKYCSGAARVPRGQCTHVVLALLGRCVGDACTPQRCCSGTAWAMLSRRAGDAHEPRTRVRAPRSCCSGAVLPPVCRRAGAALGWAHMAYSARYLWRREELHVPGRGGSFYRGGVGWRKPRGALNLRAGGCYAREIGLCAWHRMRSPGNSVLILGNEER